MRIDLTGKSAFISGSSAGIGFAIARGLHEAGAHVTLNGRNEARVKEAVTKLKSERKAGDVNGIAADVGTAAGVREVTSQLPHVDILVNNAGIFEAKPFSEIPDEDWDRFFQVNVMSGVRLSRAYLPGMLKRNWGRILFLSSESGVQIPPEMVHYGVTKTANLAVSRGLAEMTSGSGVTVNSILPGPTKSEGVATFVQDLAKKENKSFEEKEKEFFHTMRPTSLIQRFATTEEVANMCVYIASPLSSATNGASLRVDGGVVRSII